MTGAAGRGLLVAVVALAGCTRPGESRALAELDVGLAALADARVTVTAGLAAVRELRDHRLELWASAPIIELELELGSTAAGPWTIVVHNVVADATLTVAAATIVRAAGERPTVATFELDLGAGIHRIGVGPVDGAIVGGFRIAALADIQKALPEVDDVFRAISAVPDARFVVGMGDLTERGEVAEYDLFEAQLANLTIPFYTTIGNHELWGPAERYFDRFGRADFQFMFKGTAFTFLDSGDGGLDPVVEGWLDDWLAAARDQPHVVLTHMPPVDPVGTRYGSFRSSRDGHRLLAQLADGLVDLTLYGHIHTYISFENAGIPAYVSGGGGADPVLGDGIDRHFLVFDLDPAGPVPAAMVHRVE